MMHTLISSKVDECLAASIIIGILQSLLQKS